MAITALPAPPNRNDPTNFPAQGDAFLAALPQFVTDANALAAGLSIVAAGGAYAIPYTVDLTTTDSNPGSGKLRFDNSSQFSSNNIRLSTAGSSSVDYSAVLDTFDASSSVAKGSIRIVKQSDFTKFINLTVTSRTSASGYRNIGVTVLSASSSSPFAQNDAVFLFFQRTGDKGDVGASVQMVHVREEQASATAGASLGSAVATNSYQRTLNTVKQNDLGATLSNNRITLPAGKYTMRARTTLGVNIPSGASARHRAQIYNFTDSSVVGIGQNSELFNAYTSSVILDLPPAEVFCVVTIPSGSSKIFEVRTYTAATPFWGGNSTNNAPEVYSELIIEKIG